MFIQKAITGIGAVALAGTGLWAFGFFNSSAGSAPGGAGAPPQEKKAPPVVAKPLVAQADRQRPKADPNQRASRFAEEPIVIPDCHLGVIDKTEVSAQREGILLFIGRKVQDGEKIPSERKDFFRIGPKELGEYRQLKEDDPVEENEPLAMVDDRLARDEMNIKEKKLVNAKAELTVSEKTREETKSRYDTQLRLKRSKATSDEEVSAAKLTWDKYIYEVISKKAAIAVSESELQQTRTVVEYHEIRNKIRGRVKTIYKKKGEAVKSLEPVMLIQNLDRLRAEGMVDIQYLPRLQKGAKVLIEPISELGHSDPFIGHTQAITGVAVSKDPHNPLIASSSEDGTVRLWRPGSKREHKIFYHGDRTGRSPLGVRSVVCTPPGAAANWCLTGANDGSLRLWDLDGDPKKPLLEFDLDHKHRGPVNCLAFNQDGTLCASGGEDREIRIWEPATGRLKVTLTEHHGPIESLQFTSDGQLVSAAKDRTIIVWNIGDDARPPEKTFQGTKRSGEVPVLGVSPDGKRVLFDPWQMKELRLRFLPEGLYAGVIQNPSGTVGFKTLALFSPDGQLVLTGSATEGKLQLWKTPSETSRAYEVRELVSTERFRSPITCAAFYPHSPDPENTGFVVTGTKTGQVLAWPLPSSKEIEEVAIPGEVTYIDLSLDTLAHQVRIWADFENPKDPKKPDGLLLKPGGIVTVVIPPTD